MNLRGRLGCCDVSSQLPALLQERKFCGCLEGRGPEGGRDTAEGAENHPEIAAHTLCLQSTTLFIAEATAGDLPGKVRTWFQLWSHRHREVPRTPHPWTLCVVRLHRVHLSTDVFLLSRTPSFPRKEAPKYLLHAFILCKPQWWHSGRGPFWSLHLTMILLIGSQVGTGRKKEDVYLSRRPLQSLLKKFCPGPQSGSDG